MVGGALMDAMALAFDLPEGHFRPLTDRSFWCCRVIGYPPLQQAEEKTSVGDSVGEHTDYGCWTILAQDDTPGALEVKLADGSWAKAEPLPGAFVVNLGDMLSVWTRRRFAATAHRVRQTRGRYRTSVAFFYEPNYDAIIRPLPGSSGPAVTASGGAASFVAAGGQMSAGASGTGSGQSTALLERA